MGRRRASLLLCEVKLRHAFDSPGTAGLLFSYSRCFSCPAVPAGRAPIGCVSSPPGRVAKHRAPACAPYRTQAASRSTDGGIPRTLNQLKQERALREAEDTPPGAQESVSRPPRTLLRRGQGGVRSMFQISHPYSQTRMVCLLPSIIFSLVPLQYRPTMTSPPALRIELPIATPASSTAAAGVARSGSLTRSNSSKRKPPPRMDSLPSGSSPPTAPHASLPAYSAAPPAAALPAGSPPRLVRSSSLRKTPPPTLRPPSQRNLCNSRTSPGRRQSVEMKAWKRFM